MPSFDRETRGRTAGLARALLLALALCLLARRLRLGRRAELARTRRPLETGPRRQQPGGGDGRRRQHDRDLGAAEHGDPGINLQISTRAAGGAFTAPVDLALEAQDPQLAITPAGEAVAVWRHLENPPGNSRDPGRDAAARAAPSRPRSPSTRMPVDVIPQELEVAVGAGGDVVVTWSEIDPESVFTEYPDCPLRDEPRPAKQPDPMPQPDFVMASVRPAGGVFTEAQRISPPLTAPPDGETPELEEWAIEESAKAAGGARPADGRGRQRNRGLLLRSTAKTTWSSRRRGPRAGGRFDGPGTRSRNRARTRASREIGVDAAGNAIASWLRNDGSDRMVQAAIKAPGGAFAPLGDVSPAGGTAERPVLDVAPNGAATVVWRLGGRRKLPAVVDAARGRRLLATA